MVTVTVAPICKIRPYKTIAKKFKECRKIIKEKRKTSGKKETIKIQAKNSTEIRGRKIKKALFIWTIWIQECKSITGMKILFTYLKSSGIKRVYANPNYSRIHL
jgi:hypothetical protein